LVDILVDGQIDAAHPALTEFLLNPVVQYFLSNHVFHRFTPFPAGLSRRLFISPPARASSEK
jgi:hypothetical protein